jgi:hypothetical protein
MHISYEYQTSITYVDIDNSNSPLANIDKRISALREEEAAILQVCNELAKFIKQNSITPYNDDIVEYIRYFIREEEMKQNAGADNKNVIAGLQKMIEDHEREQRMFNATFNNQTTNTASNLTNNKNEPEDIFDLVAKLYKLPINGPSIRQQIEGLKQKQLQVNGKKEYFVQIPLNASASTVMQRLKHIVSQK